MCRPHLGLCPEGNVPLQGRQGSRGCIPDAPGEIQPDHTKKHVVWISPIGAQMAR